MTQVLSRIRFDLKSALHVRNRRQLDEATIRCVRCDNRDDCDRWIEQHREGEPNRLPDFCPNAAYMKALEPNSTPEK